MKKLLPLVAVLSMCAAMPAMADEKMKSDNFFNQMDTNGDGRVSMAEHDAFSQKRFSKMDANNDKMLSREEMMAHKMDKDGRHHAGIDKDKDSLEPSAGATDTPAANTNKRY